MADRADERPGPSRCERYGLDAAGRARRVALVGLDAGDGGAIEALRDRVLVPHRDAIVDAFYEELGRHPEFQKVLADGFDLERLRATFSEYVAGLGAGLQSVAYFEGRLRIGEAHARVGIPPSVYLAATRILEQAVIDRLPADGGAPLQAVLLKLITLDTALAIETYHDATVASLERSLAQHRTVERRLRRRASIDALTHLPNRTTVLATLDRVLAAPQDGAPQDGDPVCVIVADLDHFKGVNDRHGHLAGDEVLRETARRLVAATRHTDTVGRWGGEEFLTVLPATDLEAACTIAERVRATLAARPCSTEAAEVRITISQGVALWDRAEDAHALIGRADAALYEAKSAGRDCVRTAPSPRG